MTKIKDLSKQQQSELRCRKKHLSPLSSMKVGEIILHIETRNLTQLRLLKKAMDSCTSTNCSWVESQISSRFIVDVQRFISIKENKTSQPQFDLYPEGNDRLWMAHYRSDPNVGSMDGETLKIDGTLTDASLVAEEYAKEHSIILQCLRRRY